MRLSIAFFHLEDYTNITSVWSFTGPSACVGVLLHNANTLNSLLFEYEITVLNGYINYPQGFNVGRSYYYTESQITATNNLIVLGYNYHIHQQKNLFFSFKIGGGIRHAKKYTYFAGYHESNSKNLLGEPFTTYFNEAVLTARIGINYCIGYNAKVHPISWQLNTAIVNYFKMQDSLTHFYFNNFQISGEACERCKNTKAKFMKRIPHYQTCIDSLQTFNNFSDAKQFIDHDLYNRLMKPNAYNITKTSKNGKAKIRRITHDFYRYRNVKKFRELYEKFCVN